MSGASTRLRVVLVVALSGVLHAWPSSAEPSDARARAEELFEDAESEMAARKFKSACPKLEEVVRLQPQGVGAKLQLAYCYVGLGKLKAAHDLLGAAAAQATAAGQTDRAATALEKQTSLRSRVPRLTVKVEKPPAEVRVELDKVVLAGKDLGAPRTVEVGRHTIRASAPGHRVFERTIDASEGAALEVIVELKEQFIEVEGGTGDSAGADRGAGRGLTAIQVGGFVVGGVGLGLVAAGLGVGIHGVTSANEATDRYSDALAQDDPIGKDKAEQDHADGTNQATVGWALAGAAGAATLAGILMVALGGRDASADVARTWVAPWAAPGGGGLQASLAW